MSLNPVSGTSQHGPESTEPKTQADPEVQSLAHETIGSVASSNQYVRGASLLLDPKAVKSGSGISIYLEKMSQLGWWNLARFAFPPIVLIDIAFLIYCSVVPSSRFIPASAKAEFRAGLSQQLRSQKEWLHVIQLSKDLFKPGEGVSTSLEGALRIGHALSNPVQANVLINSKLSNNRPVVIPCGFFDGKEFIPTLVSIQKKQDGTLTVREFLVDHRYGTDGKTDPIRTWDMQPDKLQALVEGLSELIKPQKESADYTLEQKRLLQARIQSEAKQEEPTFIKSGIGELLQGLGTLQAEAARQKISTSKDPFKLIYVWIEDQGTVLQPGEKVLFMAQAHARMAQLVLTYSKHISMEELALLQTQLSKRLMQLEKLAKKYDVKDVKNYIESVKTIKVQGATIGAFAATTQMHLIRRSEMDRVDALSAAAPASYPEIKGIAHERLESAKPVDQKASLNQDDLETLNALELKDPKIFIKQFQSLIGRGEKLLDVKKYREAALLANGLLRAIPSPMDPFWKKCEELSLKELDQLSHLISQASKQLFEGRMHLSPTHLWNEESLNLMNARCCVMKILDIKAEQIIERLVEQNVVGIEVYRKNHNEYYKKVSEWFDGKFLTEDEAQILISNKFKDDEQAINKWIDDPYLFFNEPKDSEKFQNIKQYFKSRSILDSLNGFDQYFQIRKEAGNLMLLVTNLSSYGSDKAPKKKEKSYETISTDNHEEQLLPPQLIELRQLQVYTTCLMHPEYSLYLGFESEFGAGLWMANIVTEARKETEDQEELIEKAIELQRRDLDLKLQKMGRIELVVGNTIIGEKYKVIKIKSGDDTLEYHPGGLPLPQIAKCIQINDDVNSPNCGYLPQGMGKAVISSFPDYYIEDDPWTRYSDRKAFIRGLDEKNPTLRDQDKVLLYQLQIDDKEKSFISAINVFTAISADSKILNSEIARRRIAQVLFRPGILDVLQTKNPKYYQTIIDHFKDLSVENLDGRAFLCRIMKRMGSEMDISEFKQLLLDGKGSKEIALLYLQSSFNLPIEDEDLKALFNAWQILAALPPSSADEFSIRQKVQLHLIPTFFKDDGQIKRIWGTNLTRKQNSYVFLRPNGQTEIDFFQGTITKGEAVITRTPLPEEVRCDEQFLKIFGNAVPKYVEAESLGPSKISYTFKNGDREFTITYDRKAETIKYVQIIDNKKWIYKPIKTIEDSHMALILKSNGLWQNESGNEALLLIGTANDWRTDVSLSQRRLNVSLNSQRQIKEIRTADGKLVIHDQDNSLIKSLGIANPSSIILFKDTTSNRLGGFKIIGTELSFIRDTKGNFVSEKDPSWSIRMRQTSNFVNKFGEAYQCFMIPLTKGKENEYQIIPYAIQSKALGRKGYAIDYIQPEDQSLPILKMTGSPGQERGSHATFLYLSYQAVARGDLENAEYWLNKANSATYVKGEGDFLNDQMGQLFQQIPVNSDSQAAFLLKARLTLSRIQREQYHQLTITSDTVMSRQKEIESLVALHDRPKTSNHLSPLDEAEFQLIKQECIASILGIRAEAAKPTQSERKLPDRLPDAFYTHLIFWMEPPRKGITLEKLKQEGFNPSPEHLLKHFWDYWNLVGSKELNADGLAPLFAKPIMTTNRELRAAIDIARNLLLARAQKKQLENHLLDPKIFTQCKGLMSKLPTYKKWIGKYGAVLDLGLQQRDLNRFNAVKSELAKTFQGLKTVEQLDISKPTPGIDFQSFKQKVNTSELSQDEKDSYLSGTYPKDGPERLFLEKLIERGMPVVATRYSTVLDAKIQKLEEELKGETSTLEVKFPPFNHFIDSFPTYETHFQEITPTTTPASPKFATETLEQLQERTYLTALNEAIKTKEPTKSVKINNSEEFKTAIKEEFKKDREDALQLRKVLFGSMPKKNKEYVRLTKLIKETLDRIQQGDRTVGLIGLLEDLRKQKQLAEEVLLASLFEDYRNGTSKKDGLVAKLLLLETRLQQLEKVINLLPNLEKDNTTAKVIQTILDNSKSDRYELKSEGFQQAKVREFLVFEWTNGIILRKEQIDKIDALLRDPNALEVFRMGLGKTSAVFPLLARLQTLQNKFPVIYFPEALLEQSRDTMDKRAYIFSFSRNSPSEPLHLKELYATLLGVATTNRYVMSSIESRCYLKNKMIELNNSLLSLIEKENAAKEMKRIQEQLYWLSKIEKLLEPQEGRGGKQTVSLADEPDEVFHITHQRNYAIDQPDTVDAKVYETGKAIFKALGNHEKYGTDAILKLSEDERKSRMQELANDQAILRELAQKVCDEKFIDYVIDKTKDPPDGVDDNIRLYRHWFTQTLPILFKEIYGFDCRIEEGGHLVLPLDRGTTLPSTTYGEECELAGHQFFAYLYHQPSPKALLQIKDKLVEEGVDAKLIDGSTVLSAEDWKNIQEKYFEVLFRKTRIVEVNREQIICNVQDGINQTPVAAASGTMNPRALPATFIKPPDAATLAISAETLLKMGEDGFLDKQVQLYSSLEETMKQIAKRSKYKAIINQGETLGDKTTLDLIANIRKDSDRQFIFIHPTLRKPYIWFPGESTPRPFDKVADRSKVDESKVLYYFGPADSRGTDFKIPKGLAALFTGPATTMPDFEQAIWRMRQLGEGQTIELYSQIPQTNKKLVTSIAEQTVKKNLELNAKAALDQPKAIVRKTLRQLLYVSDPKGDPKKQADRFKRIKESFPGYFIQKSTILETLEQEFQGSKTIETMTKLLSAYNEEIAKLKKLQKDFHEDFIKKAITELEERKKYISEKWANEFAPYLPDKMDEAASTTAGIRQETQQQQQQQTQQQQQQQQQIQQSLRLGSGNLNDEDPPMDALKHDDILTDSSLYKFILAPHIPNTNFTVGVSQYFMNLYKTAHAAGEPKLVYLFLVGNGKAVATLGTALDLAALYDGFDKNEPIGVYQISSDRLIPVAGQDVLQSESTTTELRQNLLLRVAQAKLALGYKNYSEEEKDQLQNWYKGVPELEKPRFIQWLKEQSVPNQVIEVLTAGK